MRAAYTGVLSLLLTGAIFGQRQSFTAKLVGYRDMPTGTTNCITTGTEGGCFAVRVYTLEIGAMDYDVEPSNLKVALLSGGTITLAGPLYNKAIGTTWQVTIDGKKYLRVLDPRKNKGYRFLIVGERTKS